MIVRQDFPAPIFGLLLWLIFVSTGWTEMAVAGKHGPRMTVARQNSRLAC